VGGIRGAELATVNLKGERSVVQQAEWLLTLGTQDVGQFNRMGWHQKHEVHRGSYLTVDTGSMTQDMTSDEIRYTRYLRDLFLFLLNRWQHSKSDVIACVVEPVWLTIHLMTIEEALHFVVL
jgi:hypothetical protein